MASIETVAVAHKGRTTGFDYLRIGLALAVVIVHCLGMSTVAWADREKDFTPLISLILPAFFALSGFLVTGSLFRNSILEFISLRVLRLVPALAFEITLSALVLGSCYTVLPLDQYYASPGFHAYFLNIVGDIHFFLPGVFGGATINQQLWTIPYELKCYVLLVGVAFITLLPIKQHFPLALLLVTVALTGWVCWHQQGVGPLHMSGIALICAFLWGCVIFLFADRIIYSAPLAIIALVAAEVVLFYPDGHFAAIATLPVAYVTVYIGLMALPGIKFGDLSYGIFLFHLPIIQALRFGPGIENPWAVLLLTTLLSGLCALVSWNFIERPILTRKRAILTWLNHSIDRLMAAVRTSLPQNTLVTVDEG